MKKIKLFLTAITLVAGAWLAKAQSYTPCTSDPCTTNPPASCELVCNGGFEINNGAPSNSSQIGKACGWGNYFDFAYSGWCNVASGTTTDYYNTSATHTSVGIPCNIRGNETEKNGATSYIGVFASGKAIGTDPQGCWIEAVETTLKSPLVAGKVYKLSYYISLSDLSNFNTDDNVGFATYTSSPGPSSATNYTFNTSTISRSGWTQLTMTFSPTSDQDMFVVGAVQTTTNQTAATSATTGCVGQGGATNDTYYYIDDVSLVEVITPTITPSSLGGCSGETWTLTASGLDTYVWSPGGSTSTSITVNPTSTSVYTVTGTSTAGCFVNPATVTITPYACCTNSNANSFTLRDVNLVTYSASPPPGVLQWSSLTSGGFYTGTICVPSGTTITNYTFTIVNTMTISTPVSFSLCNICVCEDDIVYQNYLTKIDRSWVWGDKLWEGIISKERLEISNSFLEDAYTAVYAGNVTTYAGLICDNVVFNRNFSGITATTASVSPSNFNLTGCVFTSRRITFALHDFTPPRYTTSLAPLTSKIPEKIKGSTAHGIGNLTIRGHCGIVMNGCLSTTSVNLNIGETSGTPTTNASYTNYFDYLDGGIVNYWSKIFVKNNSFSNMIDAGGGTAIGGVVHDDANTFGDQKSTETKIGDATGGSTYKNIFNAVKYGVAASNSGTLNVSGNDFTSISLYGVSVKTWSSSATQLEPVTVASNSYTDCLYPFYAYDNNYIKCSVRQNTVTHVASTYTSGYCAYINELSKPANGTYSITSNVYSGMLNGIYMTNTSGARIVGNTVTVKKPGTGVFNAGVTLANADNSIVSDNILSCNPTNSGSWYTFGILGSTAAGSTLQCNTITKSGICIKFQGSGSPNYIHDNSLNNASTDPCLFGVVLDQSANIGDIGLYESSTWKRSDDIWGDFQYGAGGADTYAYNSSTGGTIHYNSSANAALYTPSVNLNVFPATAFSPSSNGNSNGNNCGIGARLDVSEAGGGKTIGSNSHPNLIPKKRIILRNGNTTNKEITANENAFYLVDSLMMSYIATGNSSDLNSAKSTNASIAAANNIEQNQKDFNSIYAVYLENDNLVSTNQIQDLITMSKLCPFTDGLAVYQARAMMRRWDDSTFFYNDCEINVPTQEEHARNIANSLAGANIIAEVYPNPANNSVLVQTNLKNCVFEVYDVIGKHILTQKLNENETKIDVTSFNNGTYLYKIIDSSNQVIRNGKLIISH